jgi:hypothetical protein
VYFFGLLNCVSIIQKNNLIYKNNLSDNKYFREVFIMKEEKTLEAIVKRCQGECYIEIVGYRIIKV